ncbi:hypothetical protein D3C75_775760 [compost metagenome]
MLMPASMTTDLAVSSELFRTLSTTTASFSSASSGRKMLAIINDIRITPAARAIIRSRCGNGEPSPSTSGIEKAPASVTAPRTPEIEVMSCDFSGDLGIFSLRLSNRE